MLASAMASCSADDPIEGNGNDGQEIIDNGEAVYMTVNVQLPVAGSNGRSTTENPDDDYSTSSNGTEVGKDRKQHAYSARTQKRQRLYHIRRGQQRL